MASVWVQTTGSVKFGPAAGTLTDYSASVTSLSFEQEADEQTIPATFASGEVGYEPGPKVRRMAINFLTESIPTGLYDEFETAFEGGTSVFFETTFKTGAVSATNPKFTGEIVIDSLSLGGTRADIRQQSRTYRIKAGTFVRAVA